MRRIDVVATHSEQFDLAATHLPTQEQVTNHSVGAYQLQSRQMKMDDVTQIDISTQYRDLPSQDNVQPEVLPHQTRVIHAKKLVSLMVTVLAGVTFLFLSIDRDRAQGQSAAQVQLQKVKVKSFDDQISANVESLMEAGRQTFRFDTFGDEAFWGDLLKLHLAIKGASLGGVGPGLTPTAALALGLKVDLDALPKQLEKDLEKGRVDLNNPATTLALLKLNAVIGVKGIFQGDSLTSVGITCALCHSSVDNSLASGIGHRLDGWANRELNVGEVIALAPDLSSVGNLLGVSQNTVRQVVRSWGPGKFDAELFLDGKAFNPQQISNGVVTGTNVP